MNKHGITYFYWDYDYDSSFDNIIAKIPRAAKLGFDILEIGANVAQAYSQAEKQKLRDTAEKESIEFTYLYGLNKNADITSESAYVRNKGIKALQDIARDLAGMQEGAVLSGVLSGVWLDLIRGGRDKNRCWEHSVNSMKEAAKAAEDYGVLFNVEVVNRFEHFLLNTSEEALRYVEMVGSPNVKILLDTFHLNIEEDSIGEAIVKAGDKLGHFHIGETNRRPPGNGHIPWDEVVSALKKSNYQGAIVMEPFLLTGGSVGRAISLWRDLAADIDMDQAAKKGLEFFKNKLAAA